MNIQTSDNVNWTDGTTTVPVFPGQPYVVPNTCPGCGRCKDCGRPYETQPYPWPGYPNPYIGDLVWPYGGPFYSSTGNMTVLNDGHTYQVWN